MGGGSAFNERIIAFGSSQWNAGSTRLLTGTVPFQVYEDTRRDAAAREQPRIERNAPIRDQASPAGLREAMEEPLPEADPPLGLRWNPWDIASLHVVDTA